MAHCGAKKRRVGREGSMLRRRQERHICLQRCIWKARRRDRRFGHPKQGQLHLAVMKKEDMRATRRNPCILIIWFRWSVLGSNLDNGVIWNIDIGKGKDISRADRGINTCGRREWVW